jgi:hypothetical protein
MPSSFQSAARSSMVAGKASSSAHSTRVSAFRFMSTTNGSGKDDTNEFDDDQVIEEGEEVDDDAYESYEDFDETDNYKDERFEKRNKSDKRKDDEASKRRIWLDPSTPLEDRVSRFLNRSLGTLHPLDITLASVDLIRECGKMKSFEGLNYAHDILDRLLEEKRFVNSSNDTSQPPIVISERPFKVLMYGWSNVCRTVSFAPQRMREILDLMVKEAEYDEEIKAELGSTTRTMEENENLSEQEPEDIFEGSSCQPTVDIYNTLLQGLIQASHRSIAAAGEAEQVLMRMNMMHRKRGWHTKVMNYSAC